MDVNIYLNFNGDCLEAMNFYAKTLGGETFGIFRNGDVPDPQYRMPGGDDLVMNMSLRLGNAVMMASDIPPERYGKPQAFEVNISPDSAAEAERIWKAFSDGAREITMPLGETFWAERFGMLTDRYGTPWMINFAGAKRMN